MTKKKKQKICGVPFSEVFMEQDRHDARIALIKAFKPAELKVSKEFHEKYVGSAKVTAKPAPGERKHEEMRPCDDGVKGYKNDAHKLRYDEIPVHALEELAKVYTHGFHRYPVGNARKGMDWTRPYGALWRHVTAWVMGESIDKDSGCHHLLHAAWNIFTLFEYERLSGGNDDLRGQNK